MMKISVIKNLWDQTLLKKYYQEYLFIFLMSFVLSYGGIKAIHQVFFAPYFTIIISAYNYDKYLPQTLDSVLSSSDKSFEIIVVNDGSQDKTKDILNDYLKKYPQIRLITQKNQGLSVSRNRAMKYARGKYLWFVDADDRIDKNALLHLHQSTQHQKADIVTFKIQALDENNQLLEQTHWNDLPDIFRSNNMKTTNIDILLASDILTWPTTSGKQIYRRQFIEKNAIYFPPHTLFEDDVFLVHSLFKRADVLPLDEALYYKRQHERSIVYNKAKYYDSTLRIAFIIYNRIKLSIYQEKVAGVFGGYLAGIWKKWDTLNNLQKKHFYPLLQKTALYLDAQENDVFWFRKKLKFKEFFDAVDQSKF